MNLNQNVWAAMHRSEEETILLDVRTLEEYNQGHIPNAKLIDIQNPSNFLHELELLEPSVSDSPMFHCQFSPSLEVKFIFELSDSLLE